MNRNFALVFTTATIAAGVVVGVTGPADAASVKGRGWPHKPPTITRPAPHFPCSIAMPTWRGKCVVVPTRSAPTFPKAVR